VQLVAAQSSVRRPSGSMQRTYARPLIMELDDAVSVHTESDSETEDVSITPFQAQATLPQRQPGSQLCASPATTGDAQASARGDEAVAAAVRALAAVPTPPETLFADVVGGPCEPSGSDRHVAAAHSAAAAAVLASLAEAAAALTSPEQVDWGAAADSAAAEGSGAAAGGGGAAAGEPGQARAAPLIQEITDEPEPPPRLDAAQMLAACALYAIDSRLEVGVCSPLLRRVSPRR